MSIESFPEKEIRQKILIKLKPKKQKGRKHDKAKIYIDGKHVATTKLPNDHTRLMHEFKSKYIAAKLKLNHDDFNNLIKCPLKGPEYYKKLEATLAK